MANEKSSGLFYFLAGATAGAIFGILYAPRGGKETRDQLGQWLRDRKDKGTELLNKVREESAAKKDAFMAAARAAKDAYREAA